MTRKPPTEPKPKNAWTRKQRTCVRLLQTRFDYAKGQDKDALIAQVFSHIFDRKLRARGFEDGLSALVIREDYKFGCETPNSTRSRMYVRVIVKNSPKQLARNRKFMTKIESALQDLNLEASVQMRPGADVEKEADAKDDDQSDDSADEDDVVEQGDDHGIADAFEDAPQSYTGTGESKRESSSTTNNTEPSVGTDQSLLFDPSSSSPASESIPKEDKAPGKRASTTPTAINRPTKQRLTVSSQSTGDGSNNGEINANSMTARFTNAQLKAIANSVGGISASRFVGRESAAIDFGYKDLIDGMGYGTAGYGAVQTQVPHTARTAEEQICFQVLDLLEPTAIDIEYNKDRGVTTHVPPRLIDGTYNHEIDQAIWVVYPAQQARGLINIFCEFPLTGVPTLVRLLRAWLRGRGAM